MACSTLWLEWFGNQSQDASCYCDDDVFSYVKMFHTKTYSNISWQPNMSNHPDHVQSCLTSSACHHHLISSLLIPILIITSNDTITIIITTITTSKWRPSDVRWSSPILKHLLWISEAFSINCRCLLSLYVLKALNRHKGWTLKNVLQEIILHRLSSVYVLHIYT